MANTIKKFALETAYSYIEKDPEKNLPKLMEWVDKFAGSGPDSFEPQRAAFRNAISDPSCNWYRLLMKVFKELDPAVVKTVFSNFILNANLIGWKRQEECRSLSLIHI